MHKIIQKIENKNTEIKRKRRVCAYARVSISKDNLLNSLSNQVSYYNEYISKNNAWEFAGVYSDEGISGTSTRREQYSGYILHRFNKYEIAFIHSKTLYYNIKYL